MIQISLLPLQKKHSWYRHTSYKTSKTILSHYIFLYRNIYNVDDILDSYSMRTKNKQNRN